MTAAETLAACQAAGVTLCATSQGRLRYEGGPSPELQARIAANRAELLAILAGAGAGDGWEYPEPEAMAAARVRHQAELAAGIAHTFATLLAQAVGTGNAPKCSDVPTTFRPASGSVGTA